MLVKRIQYNTASDGLKRLIEIGLSNRSNEQTALLLSGRLALFLQTATLFGALFASVAFISYLGILAYNLTMLPVVLYLVHIDRQLGENASEMATLEATLGPGSFSLGHDILQILDRRLGHGTHETIRQRLDSRAWGIYRAMQIGIGILNVLALLFGIALFALDVPIIGGFHLPWPLFVLELIVSVVFTWWQFRAFHHVRAKDVKIAVYVVEVTNKTERIVAEGIVDNDTLGTRGVSQPADVLNTSVRITQQYSDIA